MPRSIRLAAAAAKQSPPSFGRRVAAKVTSLIAKFEALSTGSSAPTESMAKQRPPARSIESVVTYAGSVTQKTLLERTLGRKAGRLFKQYDKGKENNGVPPPKVHPPRRKLLSHETRKSTRGSRKEKTEKRIRMKLSGVFRRTGEPLDDADKKGFDGPISEDSDDVTQGRISTPPVARMLPSSFFAQLVSHDGEVPVRISTLPTVLAGSGDGEDQMLDARKFRLPPLPVQQSQSVWKRKITPPKISVKELISRFKVTESKRGDEPTPTEENPKSTAPSMGTMTEGAQSILIYPTPELDVQTAAQSPLGSDEITPKQSNMPPPKDDDMMDITGEIQMSPVSDRSIASTLAQASLASSQRSTFSTKANENSGGTLIPPPAGLKHPNTKRPNYNGSKTDFSSITVRIQAQKTTPKSQKRPATECETFYTAPTRLDTPPLPSSKKYRKTPPPDGFFAKKRTRYSASPSLYTLTSESEDTSTAESVSSRRTHTTASTSSRRSMNSRNINFSRSSGRSSNSGAIMISIGVPAVHIVTPVPVNAVQTIAIRDLVGRF